MNDTIFAAVVPALGAVAAAWFAYRQSVKVARISHDVDLRKVEAEAYERAKALYESGITQMEEQLARMREQLKEEQGISAALRKQINELESTVSRMRQQIIQAGLDIPANGQT